jgi:superfamily II DNA or RNA helicase
LVLGVAPTGFGKTVCFSNMAQRVSAAGRRINTLVHRDELLAQVSDTLSECDVRHDIIAAGRWPQHRQLATVSSVFTIVRRLDQVPAPYLLIIDEAHHAIGKSTWGKVIAHYPRALVLGVTATPWRLSGEGMGEMFEDMVLGPTTAELIAMGRLSPYRLFAPTQIDTSDLHKRGGDWVKKELEAKTDKPVITGSAVSHYKKHTDGAPAVAFCVSIAHAHHVAEQFAARGYRAVAIDGKMDKLTRRSAINDFRSGQIQVLTSCDLISEGFDCPGIVTGILLRNTASLGLYLQQVGRCLRVFNGKAEAVILDHVGNSKVHGWPDADRQWSLSGSGDVQADSGPGVKTCPQCFYVMEPHKSRCPECGHKFAPADEARNIEEVEGELREVNRKAMGEQQKLSLNPIDHIDSYAGLVAYGRHKGYRNAHAWAKHVLQQRKMRMVN